MEKVLYACSLDKHAVLWLLEQLCFYELTENRAKLRKF